MNRQEIRAWAPATVANWGPGYDLVGAAVQGLGDRVTARINPDAPGQVRILSITGDGGKLPTEAAQNTAGIAAIETLKLASRHDIGIDLHLEKGLPLGSGLGSSAASAVAAAYAVNLLCGKPLSKIELMPALLAAESAVSGYHADNVAPSILGGFVLIYRYEPLSIVQLPTPPHLHVVLITPEISIKTRDARAAVPTEVSMKQTVQNSGHLAAFLSALYDGNVALLGDATRDVIVEPARAHLIQGFYDVQRAAFDAGAYGCSISGSGPTLFAITDELSKAHSIALAMKQTFAQCAKLASHTHIAQIDTLGAREIS